MTQLEDNLGPYSVCCVIPTDPYAAGVYVEKVLLVSRKDSPGDWGFPGGKVEPGESIYNAMVREVEEETGVSIQEAHLVLGQPSRTTFAFAFYATQFRLPSRIQLAIREGAGRYDPTLPATDTEGGLRVGLIHFSVGQWLPVENGVIRHDQRWRCRTIKGDKYTFDTKQIEVWHPNTFHKTNLLTIQALIRARLVSDSALDEVPKEDE